MARQRPVQRLTSLLLLLPGGGGYRCTLRDVAEGCDLAELRRRQRLGLIPAGDPVTILEATPQTVRWGMVHRTGAIKWSDTLEIGKRRGALPELSDGPVDLPFGKPA